MIITLDTEELYDGDCALRDDEERYVLRNNFLRNCGATESKPEHYAEWLTAWIKQGGEMTHYQDRPLRLMSPSHDTSQAIPTGYGASLMNLLVTPKTGQLHNLNPTSEDYRRGWEWGHTTVYTLVDGHAYTNQSNYIACYSDILPLLSGTVRKTAEMLRRKEAEKNLARKSELVKRHKRKVRSSSEYRVDDTNSVPTEGRVNTPEVNPGPALAPPGFDSDTRACLEVAAREINDINRKSLGDPSYSELNLAVDIDHITLDMLGVSVVSAGAPASKTLQLVYKLGDKHPISTSAIVIGAMSVVMLVLLALIAFLLVC